MIAGLNLERGDMYMIKLDSSIGFYGLNSAADETSMIQGVVYCHSIKADDFCEHIFESGYAYIFSSLMLTQYIAEIEKVIEIFQSRRDLALIFYTDTIPDKIEKIFQKADIPIFYVTTEKKVSEIIQKVYEQIQEKKQNTEDLEEIFDVIIKGTYSSIGRIIFHAHSLGVNLEAENTIIDFYCPLELDSICFEQIYEKIKEDVFMQLGKKTLITKSKNDIIILYPKETQIDINLFGEKIIEKLAAYSGNNQWYAGVGISVKTVDKLSDCYFQARRAVRLQKFTKGNKKICFFEDVGIYNLLFNIRDKQILKDFYKTYLGLLEEYDQLNDSNLTHTLEVYLEKNCNSQITADTLFIHRNTLRYRLEKISSIIKKDLENRSVDAEYIVAFMIKNYLNSIEKTGEEKRI